jgi:3-oxoacyl-[acyl-carrier-protein] synthase II
MPACHVAIYNDLRGPNNSITVREASANLAIAEAFATIARGSAEAMLVGATGSRIHPLRSTHTVLQEEVAGGDGDPATLSRPFDRNRRGMVMGEGAAALLVEELGFAQRRGAKILGEIVGYGASAVMGRDGVADRTAALVNAMRQGLRSAGLEPRQVGHVHAHGLGTQRGDVAEAAAIQTVFGSPDQAVPVVAAKSFFGNLGAASGMVELLCSVLALEHGELFGTLNYEQPDPECPVRVVTQEQLLTEGVSAGESVLSINVTPQAQASAVVVRRFSPAA